MSDDLSGFNMFFSVEKSGTSNVEYLDYSILSTYAEWCEVKEALDLAQAKVNDLNNDLNALTSEYARLVKNRSDLDDEDRPHKAL